MMYSEVNWEVDGDEIVVSIREQLPFVDDVLCYNVKFNRDDDCCAIAAEPVSFTKDFDTTQDGYIEGTIDLPINMLPSAVLEMAEKKALDIVEGVIRQEIADRGDDGVFLDGSW